MRGVADVVDAVNLARKLSFEVAVRGGGHNVAGRATIDGPAALHRRGAPEKKSRSGLQSACDELIDKGAIITGE